MDLLLIAGASALLFAGVLIAAIGALAPSLSEFFDRPLCWVFGHKPDRYMFPTMYRGQHSEVWRCARGHGLVTYVGGRHE